MVLSAPHTDRWPIVRLGDVADTCLGKMLDAQKNKGTPQPYLRNPNIRWFGIDLSDVQLMPFEEHEEERYGLLEGDVVVCEGGEAGRAAIWDGRLPRMKFQKAIHRVRCGPRLHNRFLVHRLMADYFSGRLADYYTGATIKHFTGQDLQRYSFPLPPLPEQHRIARILDKTDALRTKRRAAIAQLDTLNQSIFLDMFGDPNTNQKGWQYKTLRKCSLAIQIGPFGSLLHKEDYVSHGIPLVNPKHIKDGEIKVGREESLTPRKFSQLTNYHLKPGDVVMGRRGEMGRCAIVSEKAGPLLCGTGSLWIRPDTNQITSLFLKTLLSSQSYRTKLEKLSLGQTLPNLNGGIVERLEVPVPPLSMLTQFGKMIEAIRQTRMQYEAAMVNHDLLFHSLQHQVFYVDHITRAATGNTRYARSD